MSYFSYSEKFNGVADVFMRSPDTYRPLLAFLENVMLGPSDLSIEEREIVAAHVSHINGCEFCVHAHVATLRALGVSAEVLSAVAIGARDIPGNERMPELLAFAGKLTRSPASVRQTDIGALTQVGISEQTIEDLINVVSLFNYVNRLVDAFGVVGNPKYFDAVGRSLAKNGYQRLLPAAS